MGFRRLRRLLSVELPLAVPSSRPGLRVAAVSNVSIVSVAVAHRRSRSSAPVHRRLPTGASRTEIVAGIVGCVLLALLFDAVIRRWAPGLITPWQRVAR